jgi:succinate dehydrogenase / fumarate reductase flavoprotein subunit
VLLKGVPFAREYGGYLTTVLWRNFGVSYFYAKGQTGQQLLLGAYSAMNRQMGRGKINTAKRHEMLDLVIVDGKARGIIARDLVTGEIEDIQHTQWCTSGGYETFLFVYPCDGF